MKTIYEKIKNKLYYLKTLPKLIISYRNLEKLSKNDPFIVVHGTIKWLIFGRILFFPIVDIRKILQPGDQKFFKKLISMIEKSLTTNDKHSAILREEGGDFTSDSTFENQNNILLNDLTEIHALNIYFKYHFTSLSKFISEGAILDLGANVGIFAKSISKKFPNQKIFAFEPHPEIYKKLLDNVSKDNKNIECHQVCLGDKGIKVSEILLDENCFTMTRVVNKKNLNSITVPTISIDEFCQKNNISKVNFIKLDIEGSERFALKGATETLKKFRPLLTISGYHLIDDVPVLVNILKQAVPDYKIIISKDLHIYAY